MTERELAGGLGLGDYTASQLYKRLYKFASNCELHSYGVYLMDVDTWIRWVCSGEDFDTFKEHYPRWAEPKWRYIQHKDAVSP